MIRKFKLKNEYGAEYDLNDKSHFLIKPEGLGFSLEKSYTRISSTWVNNFLRDSQNEIRGEIIFTSNSPYKELKKFLKYAFSSEKLTMVYITDAGEYLRDVDLTELDKSEMDNGVLSCPVTFTAKSLWYQSVINRIIIDLTTADIVRYPYRFPSRFADYSGGEAELFNDSSIPAPFTVLFEGPVINPTITITKGSEILKVRIKADASRGDAIRYSSIDGDLYCELIKENGEVKNLVSGLDINNENFFKIPCGASNLRVESDSGIESPITVNVYKMYRAV